MQGGVRGESTRKTKMRHTEREKGTKRGRTGIGRMIKKETKGRHLFEEDEACLINERNSLDHDDKHHDERRDRVRKQPRVPPLSAVFDDAGVCHNERGS